MTELETQLFDKLDVVMAIGKRGNKLAVLIPEDARAGIIALLEVRDEYIRRDKFLLASPTTQNSESLKSAIAELGLEMPNYFTATRLRKYCATTFQLSLTDDFEILTRHMDHDRNVHNEFYRPPDTTLELTKAEVLMDCLDSGTSQYAGKNLGTILNVPSDEMQVGDEDKAQEESENHVQEDESPKGKGETEERRSHVRFTPAQTNVLTKLLNVQGQVPKTSFLRTLPARHVLWAECRRD